MRKLASVLGSLFVLAFALVTGVGAAHAADVTPYEQGRWVGSAGLGVGGLLNAYGASQSPLLGVSAEYGLTEELSVGGTLAHASSTAREYDGYGNTYESKWGYTLVAARVSYHLADLVDNDRLDVYGGGSLGYNNVSLKARANSSTYAAGSLSYLLYGVHAGARYWFTDKLAGYGEVGYGLGNLAVGVSMKF